MIIPNIWENKSHVPNHQPVWVCSMFRLVWTSPHPGTFNGGHSAIPMSIQYLQQKSPHSSTKATIKLHGCPQLSVHQAVNVGIAMINHQFYPFMVIWGMVYYCYTNITVLPHQIHFVAPLAFEMFRERWHIWRMTTAFFFRMILGLKPNSLVAMCPRCFWQVIWKKHCKVVPRFYKRSVGLCWSNFTIVCGGYNHR